MLFISVYHLDVFAIKWFGAVDGGLHLSSIVQIERSSNGNLKFISVPVINDPSRHFSLADSGIRQKICNVQKNWNWLRKCLSKTQASVFPEKKWNLNYYSVFGFTSFSILSRIIMSSLPSTNWDRNDDYQQQQDKDCRTHHREDVDPTLV